MSQLLMITNTLKLINKIVPEVMVNSENSIGIADSDVINKFVDDPNFPVLVSFPRTGSHWLRMIMELYFEKPSLVRVFYYKDCQDYLTIHTHDMDLKLLRKNVIYLYRNPVATIYSQMMYEKEDINDLQRISYWANLYGKHLSKWLIEETKSEKKTILRYENMVQDIVSEFCKVATHFNESLNVYKLRQAAEKVSKEEVKKKTSHDRKVINQRKYYQKKRQYFFDNYADLVAELIVKQNQKITSHLN
jgi:hypothetical protein